MKTVTTKQQLKMLWRPWEQEKRKECLGFTEQMYLFTEAKKLDLKLALQLSSSTDKDEKKYWQRG